MRAAALLAALVLAAGCGVSRSYEVHLAVGCTPASADRCRVKSVRTCSAAGIDAVEIAAIQDGARTIDRFPCFVPGEGAVARGPDLDPGPVTLEVAPLGPSGLRLGKPVTARAAIPDEGFVRVYVSLPRPPACADGVDNDRDGRVDLADPGCSGAADTSER